MPKVSVIIPVYGVEDYIERCARSLFEQTLDDIEYIFVDDCSPDNSVHILLDVLNEYPNRVVQTRIVKMPVNSGQAAVRKYAMSLVTGEYIIHCDSDDWVNQTMYEDLYNKAIEGSYDMVICDYYISQSLEDNLHIVQDLKSSPLQLLHDLLSEKIHSAVWNKLVKKNLYDNEIMYPAHNLREDLALMVQLVYFSKSIGYINKPYYHYFLNTESITQKKLSVEQAVRRSMQSIRNCELMDAFLINHGVSTEYKTDMICMKLRLKNGIACMTNTKEGRKQWRSLFSELKCCDILKSAASYRLKFIYIAVYAGLYPVMKFIYDKLR